MQRKRLILISFILLVVVSVVLAIEIPKLPIFDLENSTNKEIIYRHKIFPDNYIKIRTDQFHYNCLSKCTIPVYVINNFYDGAGEVEPIVEFEGEDELTSKPHKKQLKDKKSTEEIVTYITLDVPTNTENKKFNITFELFGENFTLDPEVTGCTENATFITCEHGTFTGNSITTSKSIFIRNATIDGTTGASVVFNATNNATQTLTVTIWDSIIKGNGASGSNSAGVSDTCTGVNTLYSSNDGTSGQSGLVESKALLYLRNATIYANGGNGGNSGDVTITDGAGNNCDVVSGDGGDGGNGNFTAPLVEAINSSINASGGNGGNCGNVNNGETTCGSGCGATSCATSSGNPGGNGFFRNTLLQNSTTPWKNVTITLNSGNGGNAGSCTSGSFGTAQGGGSAPTPNFILSASNLDMRGNNISVRGGIGGTGSTGSFCEGGSTGSSAFGNFYMEISTSISFRDFNLSVAPTNENKTINLTSTSSNKFGFFRSVANFNLSISCSAGALTVGNTSLFNFSTKNCGTITYVSEAQFDEEITITLNSPVNNTYNATLLGVNVTVSNTAGNTFQNVSLVVNSTTNATSTSISNNQNFPINMSSITDGNYDWYIRACSTSGTCQNSQTRIYHFDNTSPSITLVNPVSAGNISVFNLTLNITVQSSTLNYSNVTVYASNGTSVFTLTLTTTNDGDVLYFGGVVNFTTDRNNTVNVTARDKAGLETNTSTWYYFDNIAPNITISSPTEAQIVTTQTPTLSFSFVDKITSLQCQYWVVRNATGVFEINPTTIICNTTTATSVTSPQLTDGLNYTLHVNVTDGKILNETIRDFKVSLAVAPGGPSSSGGGNSGAQTISVPDEGIEFTITSDTGSSFYEFVILPNDYRNRGIVIKNKQKAVDGIKLECIGEKICDWINLSEKTIAVGESQDKTVRFRITVPENIKYGSYAGQIKASYGDVAVYLDLRAEVSIFGFILKNVVIYPPVILPAWSIGIFAFIVSLIGSILLTSAFLPKKDIGILISVISSVIVTIVVITII